MNESADTVTLKNGAEVLAHQRVTHPLTEKHEYIVLAVWRDEFVTWHADDDGNTVSGHYFPRSDFSKAVRDYEFRAGIVHQR
jgi:hypothetical protein